MVSTAFGPVSPRGARRYANVRIERPQVLRRARSALREARGESTSDSHDLATPTTVSLPTTGRMGRVPYGEGPPIAELAGQPRSDKP